MEALIIVAKLIAAIAVIGVAWHAASAVYLVCWSWYNSKRGN